MNQPTIVTCGACGGKCARPKGATPENTELPLVWSRTLIGGRFLPSCSQPCREQLQAKIGDYAAKRAA